MTGTKTLVKSVMIPSTKWSAVMFQYKRNLAAMIVAASLVVGWIGVLSRFFHHNYVGIVTSLATVGIRLEWKDKE